MDKLTEVKISIDSLYHFIWCNNWKACYLAFKKCPIDFNEKVEQCFSGDKRKLALTLYKEAMLSMIDWLQTKFENRGFVC